MYVICHGIFFVASPSSVGVTILNLVLNNTENGFDDFETLRIGMPFYSKILYLNSSQNINTFN